jgi:hypothetical protein
MNGWKRIGIVLSVIWSVGFTPWAWVTALENASAISLSSFESCFDRYDASNALERNKAKFEACMKPVNARFEADNLRLRSWAGVMPFVGIDLAIILVGWLIVWGISAVVRWIAAGFAKA